MTIIHTKATWDQIQHLELNRICDLANDGLEKCREALGRSTFAGMLEHWYPYIITILSTVAFGLLVRRLREPLHRRPARATLGARNSLNQFATRRHENGKLGF